MMSLDTSIAPIYLCSMRILRQRICMCCCPTYVSLANEAAT
jgi:hypothetical protein